MFLGHRLLGCGTSTQRPQDFGTRWRRRFLATRLQTSAKPSSCHNLETLRLPSSRSRTPNRPSKPTASLQASILFAAPHTKRRRVEPRSDQASLLAATNIHAQVIAIPSSYELTGAALSGAGKKLTKVQVRKYCQGCPLGAAVGQCLSLGHPRGGPAAPNEDRQVRSVVPKGSGLCCLSQRWLGVQP